MKVEELEIGMCINPNAVINSTFSEEFLRDLKEGLMIYDIERKYGYTRVVLDFKLTPTHSKNKYHCTAVQTLALICDNIISNQKIVGKVLTRLELICE